jgi:predicted aspartyl protease
VSAPAFSLRTDVAEHPTVAIERGPTGHIFVAAQLGDGRSLHLLLDSGASQSVVATSSPALAEANNLPPEVGLSAEAAGATIPVTRKVTFDTLRIGDRNLSGLPLTVLELGPLTERLGRAVDGILGLDVLAHDGFWLDFVDDRLSLVSPERTFAMPAGGHRYEAIDFQVTEHGLVTVDVRTAAGTRIPAIVDLGAAQTLMNRRALDAFGGNALDGNSASRPSAAHGADATPLSVVQARIGGLRIDGLSFPGMTVHVADLPVFDVLGYRDRPVVLLGLDLFDRRVVGADFAAKRLHVSAPDA